MVPGHIPRKNLDCDVASELGVPGPVNLSHSPRPEGREDFVGAQTGARRQGHESAGILPSAGGRGEKDRPPVNGTSGRWRATSRRLYCPRRISTPATLAHERGSDPDATVEFS